MITSLGYTLWIWTVYIRFLKGADMQNDTLSVLDETSLRILLVLSSKQALSLADIARAVDLDIEKARESLRFLEHKHFVSLKNGVYKISREGMTYIFEKGMQLPKSLKPPKPPNSEVDPTLPLFGSWQDLIFWVFYIILSFVVIMGVPLLFVHRMPNEIVKITIWVIFLLLWLVTMFFSFKSAYHSVPEYERMVIFRLGKCVGAKGPGPILTLPIDRPKTVDLRVKHQEVPHESCITQDNVQIDVDFVFYWKIQQPVWSITKVTDPEESIKLLATALLRAVIAHFPFNDVLLKRESINDMLKEKIDEISSEWGVYVTTMEIREIKPPEEIVKSMHKQREAEWLRLATVINADAQAQALKLLYNIASIIDDKTLSLKYFEMLKDLGQGEATKYIFPLELTNLIKPLVNALKSRTADNLLDGNPDSSTGESDNSNGKPEEP